MSPTSPITPARRYRDEFSHLALAFNKMIHELERRHTILIESHKTRAIGNLVDGVAHEPNNPLNNIFLTASALEEVLRGSIRLVSDQVKMGKVALEASIPPDLPPVHGDGQMLAQVFVNLILNAVDVLPEKGRTWIEVHPNPGKESIAVDVRDDGPGIPEHVMDRIFDPFFTTKAGGTGLGLSVSMGIVKKLGGHIEVRSRQGEGTTFTVLLPKTDIPFSGHGRIASRAAGDP